MINVLKSTAIAALLLSTSLFASEDDFDWSTYGVDEATLPAGSATNPVGTNTVGDVKKVEKDEFDWSTYGDDTDISTAKGVTDNAVNDAALSTTKGLTSNSSAVPAVLATPPK